MDAMKDWNVADEASWRLTPSPVPDGEEAEVLFPVGSSHPILVLCNQQKNRWMLPSELPSASNKPVTFCWFELAARQQVVIDPALWSWPAGRQAGPSSATTATGRSLFNYVLVDIYRGLVLRKFDPQLEVLGDRWQLSRASIQQICARLWTRATSPKINGFKWLLLHRSLATADRYREWLDRQGGAYCAGCAGAPNSTEHVLFDCLAAQQLWSHLRSSFRRQLGITVQFTRHFVLLGLPETDAQTALAKLRWWESCRAAGIFALWRSWTGRTFGGQQRLSLLAILHIIWHHLWELGRARLGRSSKRFEAQQWQKLGLCGGPPTALQWRQGAQAWWTRNAHLVGTLADPLPPGPSSRPGGRQLPPFSTPDVIGFSAATDQEDLEEPITHDGSPFTFADATDGVAAADDRARQATARARRRFLGDDALMLASRHGWPIMLSTGDWWTFELL